tara:strand:+ start:1824 stop:2057 length:234 start_codon:yes stop_codon:yes gene_type:complete
MKTKTRYGSTIHSDDTIQITQDYTFTDIEELRVFWNNRKSISNSGSWTADIKMMIISLSDYVKSEVYFAHIEGDEEE